jgi:hypothetical protein
VKIVAKTAATADEEPPLAVLKHACIARGLKYSAGRFAIANGLPFIRIGRAIYVYLEDLDQWLRSRVERAS